MDKRLFLAIALSMLVLIGYYLVFPPPQPTKPPAQPANAEAPAQPAQGSTTATAPAQAVLRLVNQPCSSKTASKRPSALR